MKSRQWNRRTGEDAPFFLYFDAITAAQVQNIFVCKLHGENKAAIASNEYYIFWKYAMNSWISIEWKILR